MKALRMLVAVLLFPPLIAACAPVSFAVSALAMPVLSMHLAASICPMAEEIAALLAVTVTVQGDDVTRRPDVPATVSVNVAGVTMGESCRVRVEVALPPAGGVTDEGLMVADTPVGAPDVASATAELKPPTELMVTEAEAVPPTTTVTGEIELKEKSITFTRKVPVLVFPAGSLAVQVTVVEPTGKVAPDAGLHETARSDVRLSGSV